MDRHDLYELCVQSPRTIVTFLEKVHAQRPTVLREDFCGTAAVSRRWVTEGLRRGELWRSLAADLDQPTLEKARQLAAAEGAADGIQFLHTDCIRAQPDLTEDADVIYIGNFSIGEIHHPADLSLYFSHCHRRLALGNLGFGGGVLVFDLYGGPEAFEPTILHRTHTARSGARIDYTWRHEHADPASRMVQNSISFVIHDDAGQTRFDRAFVYRWRLWTFDELHAALQHAGFGEIRLHTTIALAPNQSPQPLASPRELPLNWIACIVARQA